MPYRNLEPVSKQVTIVIGLTVVGFMAFGLALSFYRNILFEETLLTIGRENDKLQDEIRSSQNQLAYYESAQYKDKYAKENLGRLNPGEKILLIQKNVASSMLGEQIPLTTGEAQETVYEENLRTMPVYLHWKLYLFERDKIAALKRGL